jgi:phage recombination protein Bet
MTAKNNVVDINKNREELITFTDEEIETIKRTVASDANNDELKMFLHVAKSYGLDPFNKEIFFWKVKGKPIIMTSRDGYLKISDRHPQYDGLVSDVVRKNDRFKRKSDGIEHEYGTNRGDIIGAYALVYRKDRSYPVYVFAPFNEYRADTKVWYQYPTAMILKVAESMALKRSFSVSGLVSREEMDVQQLEEDKESSVKKFKKKTKQDEQKKDYIDVEEGSANNSLSKREQEIKAIVGKSAKLKNDLLNYLKHAKKENGIADAEKMSINKLDDEQFAQLKSILQTFKKLA